MSDLISRQAAIDAADKIIERDTSGNNAVVNAMIAWSEYIRTLPTAEPRKGKWEVINEKEEVYSCSECGFVAFGKGEISNYCPNCGVDMMEN